MEKLKKFPLHANGNAQKEINMNEYSGLVLPMEDLFSSRVLCHTLDASLQSGLFLPQLQTVKSGETYSYRAGKKGGVSEDGSGLVYNAECNGVNGGPVRGELYYMYSDPIKAFIELFIRAGATSVKATIICHSEESLRKNIQRRPMNKFRCDTQSHVDSKTLNDDNRVVYGFVYVLNK